MARSPNRGSPRLGRYLRRRRVAGNLSLQDVARASEGYPVPISVSYLSKTELGEFVPQAGMLLTLAGVFGVPAQLLLDQVSLDLHAAQLPDEDDPDLLRSLGRQLLGDGQPHQAIACFERAVELLEQRGAADADRELLHKLYVDLAITLRGLGMQRIAEEYLKRALGDRELSEKLECYALNTLARIYADSDLLPLARIVVDGAHERARAQHNRLLELSALSLRAELERAAGEYDASERSNEEAIAGFEALGHRTHVLKLRSNLASCIVQQGVADDDGERAEAGLELHRSTLSESRWQRGSRLVCELRLELGSSLGRVGAAFDSETHLKEARKALTRAHGLAKENGWFDLAFYAAHFGMRTERALGDEGRARRQLRAMAQVRPKLQFHSREISEFDREWGRTTETGETDE